MGKRCNFDENIFNSLFLAPQDFFCKFDENKNIKSQKSLANLQNQGKPVILWQNLVKWLFHGLFLTEKNVLEKKNPV